MKHPPSVENFPVSMLEPWIESKEEHEDDCKMVHPRANDEERDPLTEK